MERAELERIIAASMKLNPGRSPEEVAKTAADAVQVLMLSQQQPPAPSSVIQMPARGETEEAGPVDFPLLNVGSVAPAADEKLAEPPPGQKIVIPAGEGTDPGALMMAPDGADRKILRPPEAQTVRIRQLGKQPARPRLKVEDLSRIIQERTPAELDIVVTHPEKGNIPIRLQRNVISAHAINAVRLTYKHPAADDSMEVAATFFTTDEKIELTAEMERIRQTAVALYSPRPKQITSVNPVRQGSIETLMSTAVKGNADEALSAEETARLGEVRSRTFQGKHF